MILPAQNTTESPAPPGDIKYSSVVLGFLFDILYHISVVLIFSAVVSGIIIDAFAELRAKNNVIMDESTTSRLWNPRRAPAAI